MCETEVAPLIKPVADGVNVTVNVQEAGVCPVAAAMLLPHGEPPPATIAKSPLAAMLFRVTAVAE